MSLCICATLWFKSSEDTLSSLLASCQDGNLQDFWPLSHGMATLDKSACSIVHLGCLLPFLFKYNIMVL